MSEASKFAATGTWHLSAFAGTFWNGRVSWPMRKALSVGLPQLFGNWQLIEKCILPQFTGKKFSKGHKLTLTLTLTQIGLGVVYLLTVT